MTRLVADRIGRVRSRGRRPSTTKCSRPGGRTLAMRRTSRAGTMRVAPPWMTSSGTSSTSGEDAARLGLPRVGAEPPRDHVERRARADARPRTASRIRPRRAGQLAARRNRRRAPRCAAAARGRRPRRRRVAVRRRGDRRPARRATRARRCRPSTCRRARPASSRARRARRARPRRPRPPHPERRRPVVRPAVPAEVEPQHARRPAQERARTRRGPGRSSPSSRGGGGPPRADRHPVPVPAGVRGQPARRQPHAVARPEAHDLAAERSSAGPSEASSGVRRGASRIRSATRRGEARAQTPDKTPSASRNARITARRRPRGRQRVEHERLQSPSSRDRRDLVGRANEPLSLSVSRIATGRPAASAT